MAILGVDDFKSKLTGGGARANMFKVTCNFPGYAQGDVELTSFLCKGAQLPASIIAPITVPFRGRQLQIAGDRTFEPWTITVINDSEFNVRNAFERWMNGINDLQTNTGVTNVTEYTADMVVQQLDRDDAVLKQYVLTSCWPTAISAIDLNMDTASEVETFEITWRYTSFNAGV